VQFGDLALEIREMILTEAVRNRSMKRALRLRLVNKSLRDIVDETVCRLRKQCLSFLHA
jgi:hypothetical protein